MPDKHLTRPELLKAARRQDVTGNLHLTQCEECSDLVQLLRQFAVSGKLHLPDAPIGWVKKAMALATESGLAAKLRKRVAELTFDSWTIPIAIGVRGGAVESDRRLRFQCDSIRFDLRAEKQSDGWAFIAQVKGSSESPLELLADKKTITADNAGIYQWTNKRPPRSITLHSGEFVIELPELSWKKKKSS